MQANQLISQITLDVIEPLCDESRNLFLDTNIPEEDYIRIEFFVSPKNGLDVSRYRIKTFSIRKHWQTGQMVEGNHSHQAQRWLDKLPEKKRSGNSYIVPASDIFALMVNHHWKNQKRIIFDSPEVENSFKFLLLRFLQQTARVRNRKNLDNFEYLDHPQYPLNVYQQQALRSSIDALGYALFMEQGTGKTPVVIARICNEAMRHDGPYRVLIVAPKNVRTNWVHELHKFATVPGRVTVVKGDGELERTKCVVEAMGELAPGQKWTAVVCSYEAVSGTEFALRAVNWDLAVIDESHFIKERTTKRWKYLEVLRDSCRQRMALTGTPICNSPYDLYTQLEWLQKNGSGFSSFGAFREFFSTYVNNPNMNATRPHERIYTFANVPMLQERLARSAFLIKKDEALPDLPKKMHDIHEVEMTREQTEVYNKVVTGLIAELDCDLADVPNSRVSFAVTNTLTKLLRLNQITSGHVGFPDEYNLDGTIAMEAGLYRFDPNPKVEALVELLRDKDPHQKTIVWSCYVQDIRTIAARLRLEGINCVTYYGDTSDEDRDAAVQAFNCDPETTVFVGNPGAGGTGLNLLGYDHSRFIMGPQVHGVRSLRRVVKDNDFTSLGVNTYEKVRKEWVYPMAPPTFCDHVIYFAQNWSYPERAQSEDRAHRRGTVGKVKYTDLVVPGTIDEEIRARVVEKQMTATAVQDVRSIIRNIMRV